MKLRTKALIVGLIVGIMLNLIIIFSAIFYGPAGISFEKFTGRGLSGNVELCIDWYINLSELPQQTARINRNFTLNINLTEREDIYYPYLNFTDNTTLFDINTTTGEIFWIPNSSHVSKTYSINISVGNNACNEPDDSMILTIYVQDANLAPVLNMPNITIYEDSWFYFNVSNYSSDPDGDALKFYDNSPLFVIGEDTGIIDWTPDDEDIGNYTIRFTIIDTGGLVDFQDVLLQVISVNDLPNLSSVADQTVQINVSHNITLAGYDDDFNDTLTFFSNYSWFLNSSGPINTTSRWAYYTVTLLFTDISLINTTFHVNVTVNDSTGASDSKLINITVVRYNHPPNITSYYPLEKEKTIYNGQCQLFNITKYDEDGTIPSTKWYVDGSDTNITADEYTFCPYNTTAYNITVVITDGLANDSESWIITVVPMPPYISPSTTPSGAGSGGAGMFCEPRWVCTDWNWCQPGNIQKRECIDRNGCGKLDNKPLEIQACIYTEFPTCFDGIKNQDEIVADCGGSICKPCPTCDDGIQNQGEEGIDCGGPCPVCKELLAPAKVEKIPIELNQIVSNLSLYWLFWLLVSILLLSMIRAVREVNLEKIKAAAKRKEDPVRRVNRLLNMSYKEIKAKNHEKAKEYYNEAKAIYEKLPDSDKAKVTLKGI